MTANMQLAAQPVVSLPIDEVRRRIGLLFDGEDPVSVVDVDGTIVDANDGWWRLLGYTAAETVGTSMLAYAPPGGSSDIATRFTEALAKRTGRMDDVLICHRDGTVMLVD